MVKAGKNYKLTMAANGVREIFNEKLSLTGAEISINELSAGASIPFVHAHKLNEEVYIIIEGKGQIYIDGEEMDIEKGNVFCIDPAGQRCIKAADDSTIRYICVQTLANSLTQFTETDGIIDESIKTSWLP